MRGVSRKTDEINSWRVTVLIDEQQPLALVGNLPGADIAGVYMDKIRFCIVADAAALQ